MKTFTALIALCLSVLPAYAVQLSYDTAYDNSGASLATVACSDGTNGLLTKGFSTFGSLPKFPHIGGAAAVGGWNSAACGTCWTLTYDGNSVNVLAVDHADSGFNVAQAAMDELTGGLAEELGVVDVAATQVDKSVCGL